MANTKQFEAHGYRNYESLIRVAVRDRGGKTWTMTEAETLQLIKDLNAALDQAQAENAE